jgi:pyrimidine operon attenuation protein/uracil phosphoribosyltransferase
VLVGLQPRGIHLLHRLVELLENDYGLKKVIHGKLDITFFRDDFRRQNKQLTANFSKMNISVEGKKVILIDDVLYTARSIRSALTAIDTFGRPIKIELLVLIDRRYSRELPIQPDYVGIQVDTIQNDRVVVEWEDDKKNDSIYLIKDS